MSICVRISHHRLGVTILTPWLLVSLAHRTAVAADDPPKPLTEQEIRAVVERGTKYLLSKQKADGRWDPTPFPGYYHLHGTNFGSYSMMATWARHQSMARRTGRLSGSCPAANRAQVAIIMFTAAYIAEVVRGGLQGMATGQFEAADSIGLNYYQTMRLVILPQALKIVIPPTVSQLISALKDTSLVVIIALYDLLKTTQSVLSDPNWMAFSSELYIFVALIYFGCCFFMSSYSRRLEKELDTGL